MLKNFHFSTIKYTLIHVFSTTSAQLKCIKYTISCSTFQYTKSTIAEYVIKHINSTIYL